jgi:phage terminase large subunit
LLRQRTEFDVKLPDGTVIPRGYLLRETVVSGPADNYENLPDDYKLVLASMKGRYKLRFVDGLWVAFEGSVYGDVFNEDVNVRPKPDEWVKWGGYPPPDWPRYRACDFGWENPFVFQWWAKRPERDQFWLYREIYRRHRTTSEHAERINELEKREMDTLRERVVDVSEDANEVRRWMEYLVDREYRLSVCDHDPDGRETLARRGIEMDMADKDVRAGVQTVYQLMGVDADGEPGLVFIRDAVDEVDEELVQEEKPLCTWQEVPGYRWKPAREGENAREEPVKEHDHGQDAERYLFHTLKVGGDLWAGVNA